MELRQLEYFIAICEEMHFSRASEKLFTTQSNLSQQIKFLEKELGVPLFDRMGKRITLTDAGKVLLEQSNHVFSHIKYARDAIAEMKNIQGGTLTIGVLPGDADLLFNALLVEFHRTYPKLSLSVIETTEVTEQVIKGNIDIGVTTSSVHDDRIVQIPLFNEEFSLAVPVESSFANKRTVQLKDLQYMETVMFPSNHQCRKLVDKFCTELGFHLHPKIETTTISSLINMVQQGIGVSVLPKLLLENLDNKDIKIIKLTNPTPSQNICIVYRTEKYLGFAARAFIDTLNTYIETAINHAEVINDHTS
ncbi:MULTISPECIES: LysR family transcriptional regulator [Neobacillus]|uniref:LysR family transcriptional regulator n=1 Tax=Neobacillus citreus TaxID=2833578 RepID=A0A942T576_9BACI|nr:LysR family transcriptional regulator [Neobacillus citreus]MCH6264876.1 LysR family transcriptional regulator [Neobacillus citreus]